MRPLNLLILASLASSAAAADKPPIALEPTSQWVVDYAANNCRLIRTFGTDKQAVKLVFEQVAPGSQMSIMMVGKVRAASENNILDFPPLAGVRIGRGQSFSTVDDRDKVVFWHGGLGRGRWGLITDARAAELRKAAPAASEESRSAPANDKPSALKWRDHDWAVEPLDQQTADDAAFSRRAAQVQAIVFNGGRSSALSLRSGPMDKAFQALQQCASDSLPDWGIDPAVQATIATGARPVADAHSSFTSDDYPKAALQSFKEDTLGVWLNIDAAGAIGACRAISDFATPEINDAVCGMIKRKERFVPARTRDGSPVPDFYIQSFVFRLAPPGP